MSDSEMSGVSINVTGQEHSCFGYTLRAIKSHFHTDVCSFSATNNSPRLIKAMFWQTEFIFLSQDVKKKGKSSQ